jgi:NADH-quinone oxidoreductase subunit G
MSARPEPPPEETVNIEIDGRPYQARKGAMIIEVADAAGIAIPRFCYHRKLSVAANCRMCMVEVEKVPKPLPACATPVTEGMKVYTQSELATGTQKAVMEFLLINHPLDCPICDQGGECELQDLALGYGRDISRFAENKRVVSHKYVGPLIATDMTRCIHCTRCIRMLREVAGKMELGATGRGEHMEIGTYIGRSLESELSGNVIDVCPVGALTSRPFRFKARAWELQQHPTVAPHDAIGSNLYVHTRRGQVMRAVPREHEDINEVWLSDRDRFGCEGLYAEDRLATPQVQSGGEWQSTDWEGALQATVDGLRNVIRQYGADQLGVLVSPTATLEEMSLLQAIAAGIGVRNIDHRLRQADFADQDSAPLCPSLGQTLVELEQVDAALLVGANLRKEQPIAGHRLRKAALRGAQVMAVNPVDFEVTYPLLASCVVPPSRMAQALAGIAACFPDAGKQGSDAVRQMISAARPDDAQRAMAAALQSAERPALLLGSVAASHPQYSLLKALAGVIAGQSGARLGVLPDANAAGAWLAGVLPHRGPNGAQPESAGLHARAMLENPRKAYVLFNVEPERDCYDAATALRAVRDAEFVVSLGTYASATLRSVASVLLPVGPFTETSGTFVNAEGRWQSFSGVATPVGESRPGWKVLRVLGNHLELEGFDQDCSEAVRDALRARTGTVALDNTQQPGAVSETSRAEGLERIGEAAPYATDALVRRAAALQETPDAEASALVRIHPAEAERLGLDDGCTVRVSQDGEPVAMELRLDERVAGGCAWIQSGTAAAAQLGAAFGAVTIERA